MENHPKEPENQGRIRISNSEKRRYHIHRSLLNVIINIGVLILTVMIVMLMMKDYTDRKVVEANQILTSQSPQYNELEKIIYERESFRAAYDEFSIHVFGVAMTRDAFYKDNVQDLASGILFDTNGNILVPARMVRGRTTAFVRTMLNGEGRIFEAKVVGIDEPSGIGMVNEPALSRISKPEYKDQSLGLLQTVTVMGIPSGNPERGNLTIGGVHSREDLYTVDTGNKQTEVALFSISPGAYEGNDGGAVLTLDGTFVGMANLELTKNFGLAPYAAVIPTKELKIIGERIFKHETAESISLGVNGEIFDYNALAKTGYYVLEVNERSTADRGGIRPTDIILSIDGQPIIKNRLIDSYMKGKKTGDDLTVILLRSQEVITLIMKVY